MPAAFSLVQLEAEFHRYNEREVMGSFAVGDPKTWRERGCPTEERLHMQRSMQRVETLAEAQGIWMLCPLCFHKNNGNVGTHLVDTTFRDRGVPDHLGSHGQDNRPTRWTVVSGSGLADLVLSPSILLLGACAWHGFVGMAGVPPGHAGGGF